MITQIQHAPAAAAAKITLDLTKTSVWLNLHHSKIWTGQQVTVGQCIYSCVFIIRSTQKERKRKNTVFKNRLKGVHYAKIYILDVFVFPFGSLVLLKTLEYFFKKKENKAFLGGLEN